MASSRNQNGVVESPGAAHDGHDQAEAEQERHAREYDLRIYDGHVHRFFRRFEQLENARREHDAEHAGDNGQDEEEAGACADDLLRFLNPPGAEVLPHQNDRRHRNADAQADQEEHQEIRVGRRRQGGLAEQAADPDRVDGAVQRLQHVAEQDRQREDKQRLGDRAFRQMRSGGSGCFRMGCCHDGSGLLFRWFKNSVSIIHPPQDIRKRSRDRTRHKPMAG